MPKPKKKNIYFTQETEDAIILYNKTTDPILRNKIYQQHIHYPFTKLAENIFNTFKFSYFDVSSEDVLSEVVSNLVEKIHMFKEGRGRAFSYFSIVAKNYLILHNNSNYKSYKRVDIISNMPEGWNIENDFEYQQSAIEFREFKELMLGWWDEHLTTIFNRKRDIQIADAILELIRRSDWIEDYHKKHLYLLVREMTNYKTHYITKVVNAMKGYQSDLLDEYLSTGTITMKPTEFWVLLEDELELEKIKETEEIDYE
jgi:hypothetical protein